MLVLNELETEPEHQRNFTLNFTCKQAPVSTITATFYTGTRFRVKFKVKFLWLTGSVPNSVFGYITSHSCTAIAFDDQIQSV